MNKILKNGLLFDKTQKEVKVDFNFKSCYYFIVHIIGLNLL